MVARPCGQRRGLARHHLHALLQREQRRLGRIGRHPDHQMVHQLDRALDDVEMAQRHRIEGAGIKPDALFAMRPQSSRLRRRTSSSMRSTETTRSPSSTPEDGDALGGAALDAKCWRPRTRMVWPAIGDQHQIVGFLDREGGDDGAVLLAHADGDDARAAAAGDAIFVGRACACRSRSADTASTNCSRAPSSA